MQYNPVVYGKEADNYLDQRSGDGNSNCSTIGRKSVLVKGALAPRGQRCIILQKNQSR